MRHLYQHFFEDKLWLDEIGALLIKNWKNNWVSFAFLDNSGQGIRPGLKLKRD